MIAYKSVLLLGYGNSDCLVIELGIVYLVRDQIVCNYSRKTVGRVKGFLASSLFWEHSHGWATDAQGVHARALFLWG